MFILSDNIIPATAIVVGGLVLFVTEQQVVSDNEVVGVLVHPSRELILKVCQQISVYASVCPF